MSVPVWIILSVTAWIVLGSAVALLVGRMVRYRDRQIQADVHRNVAFGVPEPRDGTDHPTVRSFRGQPRG